MTQVATVEKILNQSQAMISVVRQSACAHDCADCAGCGSSPMPIRAKAENPIDAKVGQQVVVESSSKKLMGIVGVVYILPLALFLIGYMATGMLSESLRYVTACVGFVLGILVAVKYDRHTRDQGGFQFTIRRLF